MSPERSTFVVWVTCFFPSVIGVMKAGFPPDRDGKGCEMKSIHVVFGAAGTETMIRAHNLAVSERDAFVHEIENSQDIRLVMASRYDRCIATLSAVSEEMARDRMSGMVAASRARPCAMTFEAAAQR
jgi:hypothetical protein